MTLNDLNNSLVNISQELGVTPKLKITFVRHNWIVKLYDDEIEVKTTGDYLEDALEHALNGYYKERNMFNKK
jgi:hypothetical protein